MSADFFRDYYETVKEDSLRSLAMQIYYAVDGLYDGACHRQDRKDLAPGQPLLSAPGMELRVLDTILAS